MSSCEETCCLSAEPVVRYSGLTASSRSIQYVPFFFHFFLEQLHYICDLLLSHERFLKILYIFYE